MPDLEAEWFSETVKIVKGHLQRADEIDARAREEMASAKLQVDHEYVDAGAAIFDRHYGVEEEWTRYGAQQPLLEDLADIVRRDWRTIRGWVAASLVKRRLDALNFPAPENLSLSHLCELAPLRRHDPELMAAAKIGTRCIAKQLRREVARVRATLHARASLGQGPPPPDDDEQGDERCEDDSAPRESPSLPGDAGPTARPEDVEQFFTVLHELARRRAPEHRDAFLVDVFDQAIGMLHIQDWALDRVDTRSIARELDRVFERANRARPLDARAPQFRVHSGPGALVTISQDTWRRACAPRRLLLRLAQFPAATPPPAKQIGSRGAVETLAERERQIRRAVESVARETWK